MSFIHNKLFMLSNKKSINKTIKTKEDNNNNNNNDIKKNKINDNILLIDNNNLHILKTDFENINLVRIFGKGPTFQDIEKKSNKEFNIGINQTVNELSDCDMLVINDLHNIYLIKDEIFKKIKYILTPEYLHINGTFSTNGYFKKVYEYVKEKKFIGKYIVYNLQSNRNPNINYISLPSCLTSCNTANDFVCIYLNKFVKHIEFYGVGIYLSKNYNDKFIGNGIYDEKRISKMYNDIKNKCRYYNIKYTVH
jgi:hypothetical protein